MDLLIIAGAIAVLGLMALIVLSVLQHRREGTVKAVAAPRQRASGAGGGAEDDAAPDGTAP